MKYKEPRLARTKYDDCKTNTPSIAQYRKINFVNISVGALGILESTSDSILCIMKELGIDNRTQNVITKKITNIVVRCKNFVFCRRNKTWTNPELLTF